MLHAFKVLSRMKTSTCFLWDQARSTYTILLSIVLHHRAAENTTPRKCAIRPARTVILAVLELVSIIMNSIRARGGHNGLWICASEKFSPQVFAPARAVHHSSLIYFLYTLYWSKFKRENVPIAGLQTITVSIFVQKEKCSCPTSYMCLISFDMVQLGYI